MKIRLGYFIFCILFSAMSLTDLASGATFSGKAWGYPPVDFGLDHGVISVYMGSGDPCQNPQLVKSVFADADGYFLIEGIPAGSYYLNASHSEYIPGWHPIKPDEQVPFGGYSSSCTDAEVVTVTADEEKHLGFVLTSSPRLRGNVFDNNNQPISSGGYVGLYSGDPCNTPQLVEQAIVNSDGQYFLLPHQGVII